MGTTWRASYCPWLLALVAASAISGEARQRGEARPQEPIAAIVEAFRTYDLVAISDPHGNLQTQMFLRTLVADSRFAAAANDIVVEVGNARYQDVMDRYIGGERISIEAVRPAWQNTTVPNQIWADEVLFESIRKANASRPRERQLRVLLGDPPIDWTTVKTQEDHFRWLGMRDSYPAALVQVEVLAKRRKALLVWGHLHFQRKQITSNFDMSDWRMQTIVSLIERASPTKVFTIWRLDDELEKLVPGLASWAVPSLAVTRGTTLGETDVARVSPSIALARMILKGDALVPLPREEWLTMPVEEQLDAVLYLGPAARMTGITTPAQACAQPGFLEERLRRIALTGIPAFEADRVKKVCASVPAR
jgi:hypothetical protein